MKNAFNKKRLYGLQKPLFLIFCICLNSIHENIIHAQCKLDYSHYNLVYEDQFNYPNLANFLAVQATAKSGIKQPYWEHMPSDPLWGWGSEEYNVNQLSFPTPGLLRLTCEPYPATFTNPIGRFVTHKSGMVMLYWDLDNQIRPNSPGVAYGMFEARIRLPKGDKWPAFWLTGNHETEIDIIEGNDKGASNNVHNWDIPYGSSHLQCMYDLHKKGDALWEDFHKYTVVWTPNKITFFFDGRETRTVPASMLPTGPNPSQLIISLQTNGWTWNHDQAPDFMDIDYVRIYKPCIQMGNGCKPTTYLTPADYEISFKTNNEWINHTLYDPTGSLKSVNEDYGSIAIDRSSPTNDVYYRGTDDNIYKGSRIDNDHWTNTMISETGVPRYDVKGDVVYNATHQIIVYKDKDDYIRYLYESTPGVFYSAHFDLSLSPVYKVSETPGSIKVAGDGDIIYVGKIDNKIHRLQFSSSIWIHSVIGNYPTPGQLVKGDIQVGNDIYELYYKGMDNKLQGIWYNSGIFNCVYIDINPGIGFPINDKPGSMVLSNHQILYRGTDDKLHRFYWDVTWLHQAIPHFDPMGKDLIFGNVCSNDSDGIVYTGKDGRMQSFYTDMFGNWYHVWIDDYFNTPDYLSYDPTVTATASSNTVWDGSRIYYAAKNKVFMNFTFEPCERIICDPSTVVPGDYNKKLPPQDSSLAIAATSNSHDRMSAGYASSRPTVIISPNPSTGNITITNSKNQEDHKAQVILVNMFGAQVYSEVIKFNKGKSYLRLNLSPGLYLLQIKNELGDMYQEKIIIK